MHPQLTSALTRLDNAGRDFRAAIEGIPVTLRDRKPAPGRWSANEVAEHIGIVEQLFVNRLCASIAGACSAGLGPEVEDPTMLSDQTRATVLDRTTPRNAPETVVPTGTVDAMTALATIDAGHARLKQALQAADGLALSTVIQEHRAFGPLNVYQWVDFIAGHEGRHAAQVREIATQLTSA